MRNLFLPHEKLQLLINLLIEQGYQCVGPQVRDAAIVYDTLTSMEQLPWGIRDYQTPGEYRLEKIPQHLAFSWANGPQALKPLLFKPYETVWKVTRDKNGKLIFKPEINQEAPLAVIGVRACDIAGMEVQDKTFLEKGHTDIRYQQRRQNLFLIAVNCTYSSQNCFCVSANTGPCAKSSYDIVMTEIEQGFVIHDVSSKGQAIVAQLDLAMASEQQIKSANAGSEQAADSQTKRIPLNNSRGLRDLLFNNLDHPRWDEVASRCLSCGNCTQVCPTCFCHDEKDQPVLDGSHSEHVREWDSCFTAGHSYVSGKTIREDTRKRYRQWLTHKVGSWFDQYDVSGCIGCGRCISWCPVGIDITEELAAISGESNVREK